MVGYKHSLPFASPTPPSSQTAHLICDPDFDVQRYTTHAHIHTIFRTGQTPDHGIVVLEFCDLLVSAI